MTKYHSWATRDECNIPQGSLVDNMRASVGLPVPTENFSYLSPMDGKTTFNCREKKAFRVFLWSMAQRDWIEVCAIHALGMAMFGISSHPKIKGVSGL